MNETNTSRVIAALERFIEDNCEKINVEERYNDTLDEIYSFKHVGGPFQHMLPSEVLKNCDPVAYRCGQDNYTDGEGWIEVNGNYYELDSVEKAREEFCDNLDSDFSEDEIRAAAKHAF